MYGLSCPNTFKISRAIVQKTSEVLSITEILPASNVRRLRVQQGKFIERRLRLRSCKFHQNCKLKMSILKLRVPHYKLKFEL